MDKKSKEYWENRSRENENKVYKKASDLKKELDVHCIQAKREIEKSINDLIARYMFKTDLSYADAMKYLTSKEFKEFRMSLEEYEAEIERLSEINEELANKLRIELETLAMKSRITRLDSLKTQIDIELSKKISKDYNVVEKGISEVYRDFFKIQTTDFGLTGVNTVLPKKTLKMLMQQPWSGANFSERIWGNSEALGKVLKQEIIQSFMQGVSVKDLSDRIEKRFENDRYNTERLVRTELNYAFNQTTKLSYEEAEIEEYEFLAEIDSRTSEICKKLNGEKFKVKDARAGVNYPPMHPHCRSTTVAVIDYDSIKADKKVEEKKKEVKKIKEKGIDNCKTVLEIEELMKSQNWFYIDEEFDSNKYVSLEGCDYEVAKQVFKSHQEVFEKFPQLKGKLMGTNTSNEFKNKLTYANCMYGLGGGGITLNTHWFGNYEKIVKGYLKNVECKYSPEGTDWTSIVTHELGHAIDDYLTNTLKLAGLNKGRNKPVSAMLKTKVLRKTGIKAIRLKEEVSEYATKDNFEWFAECFSEYMKSDDPRPVAKEFGKQLEEILKEVK